MTGEPATAAPEPGAGQRRRSLRGLKLSLRIPLLVIAAALVAGLAVALVDYSQASRELRRAAEDKLLALLQARTIAIADYLSSIQRDLRLQASNPFVIDALRELSQGRAAQGEDANAALRALYVTGNPYAPASRSRFDGADDGSPYSAAHRAYHPQLRNFADRYGYRDLLLLDTDGNVVYSVRKHEDFATDVDDDAADGGLARAYRAALANRASGKEVFVDFAPYGPSDGEATGFVAVLVYGAGRQPAGVLVLEMPVDRINRVMQVAAGLGETGETLIVGPDLLLRSASRLSATSGIPQQKVSIDALAGALTGESGLAISREHLDDGSTKDVLVAFQPLDFLGTRWVVAAKADLTEVYAPVEAMRDRALVNGLGIALVVALLGFAVTRLTVVRPLNAVIGAVGGLARGDRDAPLRLPPRGDEIGQVSQALVSFRSSLIERDRLAEEKQREAVLVEAGRRFRAIAQAFPLAALVADAADGTIKYANPTARVLLGLPYEGPLQATLGDFFTAPADLKTVLGAAPHAWLDNHECPMRRADGSGFPAVLSTRSLDYDGTLCLVLGVLDLTEKQAAQAEIERQREMIYHREKLGALGSLLAGVAHELNNPLSVVVAQATLLQELAKDAKTAERGEKIRLAAERCARIVKTFLAMARQKPPSHSAVDLNEVLRAALELLGYSLRTAGIEVTTELADGLPPVWGDADQLSQVLTNLIVNAQQALADWNGARRLALSTGIDRDGAVRLAIADSGPGVPPSLRARIFEPFFTTKPVGMGTGIGLSVCHGVITAHGGTITVEDAPGGGAVFVVHLPAGSRAATAPAVAAAPPPRCTGRILVVDDEREVAEALADILRIVGYDVDLAERGQEALERLRGQDYDLVISDVRMPDVDGLSLYREIKALKPALAKRLIMITGDTLSGSIRAFLEQTGLPCLEKPFVPAEVRRLVAVTLAGPDPAPAQKQ